MSNPCAKCDYYEKADDSIGWCYKYGKLIFKGALRNERT